MRSRWGKWTYDATNLALDHDDGYQIDLERCTSSAQLLDYLPQIRMKSWADCDDVRELLEAFDALLRPQAHLCSFGQHKQIKVREVRRVIERNGILS